MRSQALASSAITAVMVTELGAMEAVVAALQVEMTQLKTTFVTYEKTVKDELDTVSSGLHELYGKADIAIAKVEQRVTNLEKNKYTATESCMLLSAKDMKPNVLAKDEGWRRWKSDIEDYAEEMPQGMTDMLDTTRASEMEITETWFEATHEHWWTIVEVLHRFLKRYTGTEARRIVLGVSDDNGWEAWRKLNQHFEPGTATREAQVLAKYTNVVNRKAKTPKEPRHS